MWNIKNKNEKELIETDNRSAGQWLPEGMRGRGRANWVRGSVVW